MQAETRSRPKKAKKSLQVCRICRAENISRIKSVQLWRESADSDQWNNFLLDTMKLRLPGRCKAPSTACKECNAALQIAFTIFQKAADSTSHFVSQQDERDKHIASISKNGDSAASLRPAGSKTYFSADDDSFAAMESDILQHCDQIEKIVSALDTIEALPEIIIKLEPGNMIVPDEPENGVNGDVEQAAIFQQCDHDEKFVSILNTIKTEPELIIDMETGDMIVDDESENGINGSVGHPASSHQQQIQHQQQHQHNHQHKNSTNERIILRSDVENHITAKWAGQRAKAVKTKQLDKDNIGYRMLAKQGWSGGSIGKHGDGIVEPVSVTMKSNRAGLGANADQALTASLGYQSVFCFLSHYKLKHSEVDVMTLGPDFAERELNLFKGCCRRLGLHYRMSDENHGRTMKILKSKIY